MNRDHRGPREKFLGSPTRGNQPTKHSNTKINYSDASGTTISPLKYKRDLNGSPHQGSVEDVMVKHHILHHGLANSFKYQTLSDGFQKVFVSEDQKD